MNNSKTGLTVQVNTIHYKTQYKVHLSESTVKEID